MSWYKKFISTCFWDGSFFPWLKLLSVEEFFFCDRNILSLTKMCFSVGNWERNLFLSQFLYRNLSSKKKLFWAYYTWFQGKSVRQKWVFPLSRIIKIITLWSPEQVFKGFFKLSNVNMYYRSHDSDHVNHSFNYQALNSQKKIWTNFSNFPNIIVIISGYGYNLRAKMYITTCVYCRIVWRKKNLFILVI